MAYNLTALGDSVGMGGIVGTANDYSGGVLVGITMIALFVIMLLALKKWDFDKAIAASSFSCFFLSSALTYGGFLSDKFMWAFLIMSALSGLYLYASGR
jgi:uncharacterized membrane protein YfcA